MDQNKKWTEDEILQKSRELIGLKLSDFLTLDNIKNKGEAGQAIETQYFGLKNNSERTADFKDAGIELKVIPFNKLRNGKLSPKERMVLSLINYSNDYNIPFEESHLYKKIQKMQIIEYIHDYENFSNSVVFNSFQYELSEKDILIMKHDYDIIMNKIRSGRAHEISEGDTEYLGACTKGMGKGRDFVEQPFSDIRAKRRAFSMKPSLIRAINTIIENKMGESLFNLEEIKKSLTFEQLLEKKINKFIGKSLNDLVAKFNINKDSKSAIPSLVSKMLNINGKLQNAEEFEKAGITPKTIRIVNGMPEEQISFKAIDWEELVKTDWNDYWLQEKFETEKFAFFIFEGNDKNNLLFKGVKVWSMTEEDINEFGKIYEDTRKKCQMSGLVRVEQKLKNGVLKDIYRNAFIKQSESSLGHVRPHAANNKDVLTLPSGEVLPKQSFWLNREYVLKQIKKER